MRVALLQLDGKIPNMALMSIARHHRTKGDDVELHQVRSVNWFGGLFNDLNDFNRVYASLIFAKSKPIADRLQLLRPDAVIGGTGWDYTTTLEGIGIDPNQKDYTDYPNFRQSMGFTQRGCRLSCEFCVVPKKEGRVRSNQTIHDIWRGGSSLKELLLLDNDFFGNPHWRERINEIREGGFKVSFNQGINARMISDEAAEAIASVQYRDDSMKTKRLYTAWDNKKDEDVLVRGINRLTRAGVNPDHIMVYILIGYWADETDTDWEYRRQRLRDLGCRPYPMPFVRNPLTIGFQRFCVGAYDKRFSWSDWKAHNCRAENFGKRKTEKVSLSLFE